MLKLLIFTLLTTPYLSFAEHLKIKHGEELGGFSGLAVHEGQVLTVMDKGPNKIAIDLNKDGIDDRLFMKPKYSPKILVISKDHKTIEKVIDLRFQDKLVSSLKGHGLKKDHENKSNKILKTIGIDPEGIAVDSKGNFWISEEFGPSLVQFDSSGNYLQSIVPKNSKRIGQALLPEYLISKKSKKGFESLGFYKGSLYFMLQEPPNKDLKNILYVFDTKKKILQEFEYIMEDKKNMVSGLTINSKGEILILERNNKKGKKRFQTIFKVKLSKPLEKKEYLQLNLKNHEKLEGLTIKDKDLMIIEDNDFDSPKLKSNLFLFKAP